MRVQLRDLTPGTEYAIKFRYNNGDQSSEWSQLQRFTTTNDTIAPAPVTNLSWGQSGSSFVASWDKPTTDAQGNALLDFRDFQVDIDDTVSPYIHTVHTVDDIYILSEDEHVKAFGSRKSQLRVTVRVRDLTYNESPAVTLTSAADTPPVPSAPTLSSFVGMPRVSWDGKAAGGASMPETFSHVEVHVSTTSNFTPSDSTYSLRLFAGGTANSSVIPGLAYDTQFYVRLVAVSKLNRKSGASVQASITPARLTGLDIQNGQIGVNQINFTAFDIGGANAYYPATNVARDAIIGAKNGDIAYVTGTGYTTFRYNGSAWVAAPEVGVIQGSKILAGTVTSNAVGTNLLIASSANIANAVIDDAKITTISVAKLIAGVMSADVVISGRFATALTGQRTEINAIGLQAYDALNNLTINLDGSSNLLTGVFKTAETGRRIEIGSGGSVGRIQFIPPTGATGEIGGFTGYQTSTEALRLGMTQTGISQFWNKIQINSDNSIYSWSAFNSIVVGGGVNPANEFFSVRWATSRGTAIDSTIPDYYRLHIDDTYNRFNQMSNGGTIFYDRAANGSQATRFWIHGGGVDARIRVGGEGGAPDQSFVVNERNISDSIFPRFMVTNDRIWYQWTRQFGNARASWRGPTFTGFSPTLEMDNHYNYGVAFKFGSNPDGTSQRLEVRDAADSVFQPIWAASFVVNSDIRSKKAVEPISGVDGLGMILGLRPTTYEFVADEPKTKKIKRRDKKSEHDDAEEVELEVRSGFRKGRHLGLIGQEVHELMRQDNPEGVGVDLYPVVTALVAAVQELHAIINKDGKK